MISGPSGTTSMGGGAWRIESATATISEWMKRAAASPMARDCADRFVAPMRSNIRSFYLTASRRTSATARSTSSGVLKMPAESAGSRGVQIRGRRQNRVVSAHRCQT